MGPKAARPHDVVVLIIVASAVARSLLAGSHAGARRRRFAFPFRSEPCSRWPGVSFRGRAAAPAGYRPALIPRHDLRRCGARRTRRESAVSQCNCESTRSLTLARRTSSSYSWPASPQHQHRAEHRRALRCPASVHCFLRRNALLTGRSFGNRVLRIHSLDFAQRHGRCQHNATPTPCASVGRATEVCVSSRETEICGRLTAAAK